MAACRWPCEHDVSHGSYSTYTNHGCRCDACRETARVRRYVCEAPCRHEIVHGKLSSYSIHHCRCDLCREAASAYRRTRRAERRKLSQRELMRVMPARAHGLNGSKNWGCRCRVCRLAHAEYARRRWIRIREGRRSSE